MRIAIQGVTQADLAAFPQLTIIAQDGDTIIAETPRYRSFTKLADRLFTANKAARMVEIAGNDDILLSMHSQPDAPLPDAMEVLSVTKRPGFTGQTRALIAVKVNQLHNVLPALKQGQLEHIYDY